MLLRAGERAAVSVGEIIVNNMIILNYIRFQGLTHFGPLEQPGFVAGAALQFFSMCLGTSKL